MPNQSVAKKTASAPNIWRKKRVWAAISLVVALVIVGNVIQFSADPITLRARGHTYELEVASNAWQQEKGLGDRASMPTDHGMLFTYHKSGRYCYWMKGMQFPLDIIWLDAGKRIVHIERNLSPASYPTSYCSPGSDTRYVIELNAGQVQAARMSVGQQLDF